MSTELNIGTAADESNKDCKENDEEKSKPNDGSIEMSSFSVKPGEFCKYYVSVSEWLHKTAKQKITFYSIKMYFLSSLLLVFSKLTRERFSGSLGQLEMNPVSRAIARHMKLDLSSEGLTPQNHKGIAIIVYGAPLTSKMPIFFALSKYNRFNYSQRQTVCFFFILKLFSDKSSMASSLACHYGAACLTIDAVVTDLIQNGVSPSSLLARELYDTAAAEYEQKKAALVGKPNIPFNKWLTKMI